jgi:ABC-type phosphate transport system substrate-binding protein
MLRRPPFLIIALVLVLLADGSAQKTVRASADVQTSVATDESIAIVVNQENTIENLSMKDLRSIFLGERSHWPNGRRITLVMMEPGQLERKAILRDIYRMNETDFSRHFLQGLFTGEVFVSPKTLASPVGVRKFIFNVPGAIGYVRASDVDPTIKVVRIDGRSPEDKDYELRLQPRQGTK